MGWGGGGKGKGGGGKGGGKDWGRMKRAAENVMIKEAKNERESEYFWSKQAILGQKPPHAKNGAQLAQEERELFTSKHDGTVGINFEKYDAIDVEMSGKGSEEIVPIESFAELTSTYEFPAFLTANLKRCKYNKPTPVQRFAIPAGLGGRDIMVCAQTGSGKTCAFFVPMLSQLDESTATGSVGIVVGEPAAPRVVVMAPTRELCSQIHLEARKLLFKSKIRASEVYGGVEAKPQLWELALGSDVVTATPGRLKDFIDRGVMTMSWVSHLCLDEADRMLDMGFEPQIREIVQQRDMPSSVDGRATLMFSATFPKEIQTLARQFMKDYIWIGVGQVGAAVDTVKHEFHLANNHQKERKLLEVLRANPGETTLVFVAMKRTAAAIEAALWSMPGLKAAAIHGDMDQPAREASLAKFRSGACKVLVATDVASRGLDIPSVSHVINYDLPEQFDCYVHRIGRTGRVGREGWATSFYSNQGNYANTKILGDLLGVLQAAGQEVPPFMQKEADMNRIKPRQVNSGKGKGGKGGKRFGGSDDRGGGAHFTVAGKGKAAGAQSAAKGGGITPLAGKGKAAAAKGGASAFAGKPAAAAGKGSVAGKVGSAVAIKPAGALAVGGKAAGKSAPTVSGLKRPIALISGGKGLGGKPKKVMGSVGGFLG